MNTNQFLTEILEKAANSLSYDEIEKFLLALIDASVFIPIKETRGKNMSIIGEQSHDSSDYVFSSDNNEQILPIFTEEKFIHSWSENEFNLSKELFKSILWKIPPQTSIHINPGQNIGKIFNPLEIELLKNKDIDELIHIIKEDEVDEFQIYEISDDFKEFKSALLPVVSIYENLIEAYLLTIKEDATTSPRALIGIKYSTQPKPEHASYIRSEIERTAKEFLISPFSGIFIVDDLHNEKSPNQTLFIDFEPFYKNR